ncbi:hypothetical protein PGQ11_008956 [Apiospora arundinis]|uniref:Uncharacterized protein n=1 Tax=Apiospora arundinis TaxID=335852 RepID=A0ABR2IGL5_9PEZI
MGSTILVPSRDSKVLKSKSPPWRLCLESPKDCEIALRLTALLAKIIHHGIIEINGNHHVRIEDLRGDPEVVGWVPFAANGCQVLEQCVHMLAGCTAALEVPLIDVFFNGKLGLGGVTHLLVAHDGWLPSDCMVKVAGDGAWDLVQSSVGTVDGKHRLAAFLGVQAASCSAQEEVRWMVDSLILLAQLVVETFSADDIAPLSVRLGFSGDIGVTCLAQLIVCDGRGGSHHAKEYVEGLIRQRAVENHAACCLTEVHILSAGYRLQHGTHGRYVLTIEWHGACEEAIGIKLGHPASGDGRVHDLQNAGELVDLVFSVKGVLVLHFDE